MSDHLNSPDYWLERFRSLIDRAVFRGPQDWTVELRDRGGDLLEQFKEEYGSFSECDVCNTPGKFARQQNHGEDDRIKVCRDCDSSTHLRAAS